MPTIDTTLRTTSRRVPDREALIFAERRYTYAQLDAAVDRTARVLLQQGITPGERVTLMATNSDRFVVAFYAIHRVGAVFVPINPASAPAEIDHLVRDCDASLLVFASSVADAVGAAERTGLPADLAMLGLEELCPEFDPAEHQDVPEPVSVAVDESANAQILYTSGTTGAPKGALFDHHRVMWTAVSMAATCGMTDGDRFLHVAPLYHAAELCVMLVPGTMIGATHVILPGFDPAEVLDALESHRITMFFGVPTMYQFLLRCPDLAERDLGAWRTAMFGAAPMPASSVEQLTAALPAVNFIQLCGQTEAGPNGIFAAGQQVRERPDASGRQPLVLMESRVVDSAGIDVAAGHVGELILRGETVMKEYWNRPQATAETLVDGWLHTGDLVRVDADGYLTVVDRLKDMIITGGRNVYSVEVENAICAHPAVTDCAVIARPHPDYGESIVAFVTTSPDVIGPDSMCTGAALTVEEIRDFLSERIAAYKRPHEVHVIEQIPRSKSGKILKRSLREQVSS